MTQPTISGAKPYGALTVAVWAILSFAASAPLQAQTYTDLHDFNVTGDPYNPVSTGEITQGRDGNLWSTGRSGGGFSDGAAFNITPSGSLAALAVLTSYDFWTSQ